MYVLYRGALIWLAFFTGVVLLLVFFSVVNLPCIAKCIVLSGASVKLPVERMDSNKWFFTFKLWGDVKRSFVLNFYSVLYKFLTALETSASMCIELWAACCWLHIASNRRHSLLALHFFPIVFLVSSVRELSTWLLVTAFVLCLEATSSAICKNIRFHSVLPCCIDDVPVVSVQ